MFNGSYLRVCMKLQIVQKIRFCLLESGRTKPWCPGLVSRQSVLYFELSFLGCGFLIHLSNRSNSPRFRALWKKIRQKYRTHQGFVFIQGPSIVLPVWRCIMFNDSYLRACMKLRFVKKLDFPFMSLGGPSHGARVWCLGRVPKHRNHWQEVEGLLFSPQNS